MPSDSASAARTDDWDQACAYVASEHEAAHAVAAHHFGWSVDEVELHKDGGTTWFVPPAGLDPIRRERERAVILLAATAYAGPEGELHDRIEVFQRTRKITRTPEEHELLRRRCEYEAIQLVAEPTFRSLAERFAAALLENRGHLGGSRLKSLLAKGG